MNQSFPWYARPTGGSHGLTTDDLAQRFKGAKKRPRQMRWEKEARPAVRGTGAMMGVSAM